MVCPFFQPKLLFLDWHFVPCRCCKLLLSETQPLHLPQLPCLPSGWTLSLWTLSQNKAFSVSILSLWWEMGLFSWSSGASCCEKGCKRASLTPKFLGFWSYSVISPLAHAPAVLHFPHSMKRSKLASACCSGNVSPIYNKDYLIQYFLALNTVLIRNSLGHMVKSCAEEDLILFPGNNLYCQELMWSIYDKRRFVWWAVVQTHLPALENCTVNRLYPRAPKQMLHYK